MAQKALRKLSKYRSKRDFAVTNEPSGVGKVATSEHLRFVIQKHAARRLHYDLRLELGGVFKSWAVTKGPSPDPRDKRLSVEVEDHPLDYGDFEGTIPKGEYGGGTVQLWDRGLWAPEGNASAEEQLRKGELKFVMAGKKVEGSWVLVRLKAGRDSREGRRRTRHVCHHSPPRRSSASWTIRSHNSGNEIPAAAAACGMRLVCVMPGSVFASRQ